MILERLTEEQMRGFLGRRICPKNYYITNKIMDEEYAISANDLIENRLILLQIGKKNKLLVRVKE